MKEDILRSNPHPNVNEGAAYSEIKEIASECVNYYNSNSTTCVRDCCYRWRHHRC